MARSGLFAKASRAIIVASKACRGDMANLQLQSAIQHAKAIQLPKDRIQDAINKHEEKGKEGHAFQNMRYDAMLTLGGTKVACILTALTDNRNRTASHVRATVVRAGGELLASASHDYLFRNVGMILLESFGGDEEALWECALEAGATEVDIDNQSAMITCEPADLWSLVASLRDNAYEPAEFEHRYVVTDPSTVVLLNEEGQEKLESFLDKMDEDEDITNVYHNSTSQLWEV